MTATTAHSIDFDYVLNALGDLFGEWEIVEYDPGTSDAFFVQSKEWKMVGTTGGAIHISRREDARPNKRQTVYNKLGRLMSALRRSGVAQSGMSNWGFYLSIRTAR